MNKLKEIEQRLSRARKVAYLVAYSTYSTTAERKKQVEMIKEMLQTDSDTGNHYD